MAKRCTTVPGYGTCCSAIQQGIAKPNQPFRIQRPNGTERCAVCLVVPSKSKKHLGQPVFNFRWQKGQLCGIGPGGCPVLVQGGAAGGVGTILPPGAQFLS